LLVSFTGTTEFDRSIVLAPGEATTRGGLGWTARGSNRWTFASGDSTVTATVRAGQRSTALRLLDHTSESRVASKSARFVAIRWGTSASAVSICGQTDLESADCAMHGRTIACQSR